MEKINLIALKKFADRIIYQPEDGFTNLSTLLMRLHIENEFNYFCYQWSSVRFDNWELPLDGINRKGSQ